MAVINSGCFWIFLWLVGLTLWRELRGFFFKSWFDCFEEKGFLGFIFVFVLFIFMWFVDWDKIRSTFVKFKL